MSIQKMKFVKTSTSRENLDEMLLRALDSKLLDPISADDMLRQDEEGRTISEDNVYSDYINNFKNMAHGIGLEIGKKKTSEHAYSLEEIEAFSKELANKLELSSCGEDVVLTSDDQKALDALSECGFEALHDCRYINFGLGRLPLESYKKVELLRDRKFDLCILHSNAQYHWVVYATSNTFFAEVRKLLLSLYLEEIRIPNIDVKKVKADCEEKLEDIYAFCLKNDNIYRLYDYCIQKGDEYLIGGFVPEAKVSEYEKVFNGLDVKFEVDEPEEAGVKCPTLLKNNWFFKPFEMFVEMYSLPDYKDFDPTIFLGITYCLIFGIMFGDLGQGAILAIGGFVLYDVLHYKNKLIGIVGRVGVFSMIFGFLYGSVFGNEEVLTPVHQALFGTEGKLVEVMDAEWTTRLLIGAVLIGMVLTLISMIINMYKNIRRKDLGQLLFSTNGVAGFVFYSYVVAVILNMLVLNNSLGNIMSLPFILPLVVVPFICFFFEEPLGHLLSGKNLKPEEGWGAFIMQQIFEMIVVALEYVANTLSYLRIGGFILSHAGLMLVVTVLMGMVGGAGSIIVMIFGNILVMGLEGLIVGIQSLRLEYYEMFSRYYDGGGRKYEVLTSLE